MKEEKRYEQLFHAYAHPTQAGSLTGDYLRRLQNEAGGNSRYRSTFYNLHRANIMNRVLDIRLQHNIKTWSKMHGRNCGAIERYQNQLFERICKMIPPESPNKAVSDIMVPVPETCFQVKEMKLGLPNAKRKVSDYRLQKKFGPRKETDESTDNENGENDHSWNSEKGSKVHQNKKEQQHRKLLRNFSEKDDSWKKRQKGKLNDHRDEEMKRRNEMKPENLAWNKDQKSKDQYQLKIQRQKQNDGQQNGKNQIVSEFRKWEKKNSEEKLKGRLSTKSTSKSSLYEEQQSSQQQRQNRWRKLLEQRKIFSTSSDYTINFNLVKTFSNNLAKADLNTSEVTLVKKCYDNDVKENKTVLKTKYM